MLLVNQLREEKEKVLEALSKRHFAQTELVDQAIQYDDQRKALQYQLDNQQAEMNRVSKQIGQWMKEGKRQDAEEAKTRTADLKNTIADLKNQLAETEENLLQTLYLLPNTVQEIVKAGKSEADNEIVYQSEEIYTNNENKMPHWELATRYNLIDFELGVKVAGAGFPVYLGKGARLQRALVQFFLDKNVQAGYLEVNPPHVINEASGLGTGQLPDKEGQMYYIPDDRLYLIPTAEVPVTNLYRDTLLDEKQLPILNTAFSQCYRREAGSYGAHVRGLNRLHQFEKVEILRLELPQNSAKALDQMVDHVKTLLEALELPYRILRLCGGDTGFASSLTYDFEVWSAAQEKWLEVSSVSNFLTFQTNRLRCRYRDANGKTQLLHTLNGSAMALPRVMAALLENNQTQDSIRIPEALHPYTGFTEI